MLMLPMSVTQSVTGILTGFGVDDESAAYAISSPFGILLCVVDLQCCSSLVAIDDDHRDDLEHG
jgi:hypothetical protein